MLDNGSIHVVSAWASLNEIALGQLKTSEKSNEITAIPELLDSLFLENCMVSIDAMGCQKKIAEKIREKKADYILVVKENHPTLYEEVRSAFSSLQAEELSMPVEAGHGCVENRKYFLIKNLNNISDKGEWKDLKSIVKVESERIIKKTGEVQIFQADYELTPCMVQRFDSDGTIYKRRLIGTFAFVKTIKPQQITPQKRKKRYE